MEPHTAIVTSLGTQPGTREHYLAGHVIPGGGLRLTMAHADRDCPGLQRHSGAAVILVVTDLGILHRAKFCRRCCYSMTTAPTEGGPDK